jgi:hypothetical protein
MILVSWDGNNINDGSNYESILDAGVYGLPGVEARLGLRQGSWPLISSIKRPGKQIFFDIYIRGASLATLQKQLSQWFDPDDETPKQLIGEDSGGGGDRYVMGICTGLVEIPFSAGRRFVVSIQLDGDVFWRETSPTTPSNWNITATGQTRGLTNNGEMDARPILKIKPTSTKSAGFSYSRFMSVRWIATAAANNYPVDIANNGLDTTSTSKFQANLEDLRVYVDGVEVDRWTDPTTRNATTKVWVNLDFVANIAMTLDGAINNSIQTIVVAEDITNMPNSGIIYIDSEVIIYSGKNSQEKKFTGCSRGAKGSTAASHTDTTSVYWLQHDVMIFYGDSTLAAPTVDDGYKPMFALASSLNTNWDFDDFGETAEPNRPAQWQRVNSQNAVFYGGDQGVDGEPWVENGITVYNYTDFGSVRISNVCEISNANFNFGHKRSGSRLGWSGKIRSSTNPTEYSIPIPTANDSWETWSRDEALTSGAVWVEVELKDVGAGVQQWLEFSDCYLDIVNEPAITIVAEQTNYLLACTITNNTTGDAVELTFNMSLNEELELDTDEKTVIYLGDDSNQFNSLALVGGPRRDWLPLQPGSNTLQFDDVGTGNVTIAFEWEERLYQ